MKNLLLISVCTLLLTACGSRGNQTATDTTANNNTVTDTVSTDGTKQQDNIDLNNRKVFYLVFGETGEYRISKTQRIFIIDEKLLIEEIPHEPITYKIRNIEYRGDSVMKITLHTKIVGWKYYSNLLAGEEINWIDINDEIEWFGNKVKDETTVTLKKDKRTYIWSYQGYRNLKIIDTYDILPSGHYYANQHTVFHNPDNENFHQKEWQNPKGVFDLIEKPLIVKVDTEEYNNMERPYEGKWLMITMTDIGYVVYDYPQWEGEEGHTPDIIDLQDKTLTYMSWTNELSDYPPLEEVLVFVKDGSSYLQMGESGFSFKWIDKENRIAQWTMYREEKILQQGYYVNEAYNHFPMIMYDWD